MRVCYAGLHDPDQPRSAALLQGLEGAGIEVVRAFGRDHPTTASAPEGTGGQRTSPRQPASRLRAAARDLTSIMAVIRQVPPAGQIDAIITADGSQQLVPAAWAMSRTRNVPLVVDMLHPWAGHDGLGAVVSARRDRRAARLADRVLVGTAAHGAILAATRGGREDRQVVLPAGVPDWQLHPSPLPGRRDDRPLTVLYTSGNQPLYGAGHVLHTARQLGGDPRFRFVLAVTGNERAQLTAALSTAPAGNVELHDPVAPRALPDLAMQADICLGALGDGQLAEHTVPSTVWSALALGRPVVTVDGPGPRSLLADGRHCLLVPTREPGALTTALTRLADDADLAVRLAIEGATLVQTRFHPKTLGVELAAVVEALVQQGSNRPARQGHRTDSTS